MPVLAKTGLAVLSSVAIAMRGLSAAPGAAEAKRKSGSCTGGIIGSAAADNPSGTEGGATGSAVVAEPTTCTGLASDDCLAGGAQADTIAPGAGKDLAIAMRGDDRIEVHRRAHRPRPLRARTRRRRGRPV